MIRNIYLENIELLSWYCYCRLSRSFQAYVRYLT